MEKLMPMTYQQRAVEVMSLYLDDFTKEELKDYAEKAYRLARSSIPLPLPRCIISPREPRCWSCGMVPPAPLRIWRSMMLPHLLTASLRKKSFPFYRAKE